MMTIPALNVGENLGATYVFTLEDWLMPAGAQEHQSAEQQLMGHLEVHMLM